MSYVTRFAPSPTGPLHLGHAYSALLGFERAQATGGSFKLRMDDIDSDRCKPHWEAQAIDDLTWLGLNWSGPILRQSDTIDRYQMALTQLSDIKLVYPCRCSRRDIDAAAGAPQDGVPFHGPTAGYIRGPAVAGQ